MKKYQFKSEASLQTFIKDLEPEKYKVLEDKTIEIVAYSECKEEEGISEEMLWKLEDMQYELRYFWAELDSLWTSFGQHRKGHLPPIEGAGNLEAALKVLGMDKDYQVVKPTLYANSKGEIEVNLPSLLKEDEE